MPTPPAPDGATPTDFEDAIDRLVGALDGLDRRDVIELLFRAESDRDRLAASVIEARADIAAWRAKYEDASGAGDS